MRIGMIGLGKMGSNMVRRLRRQGIEVVGYNRSPGVVHELASEVGMEPTTTVVELVEKLAPPRIVWSMLPAGRATSEQIALLKDLLAEGDMVVDGGNSNYRDSQAHATTLEQAGIAFVDVGTSGGIWGLEEGYCLMLGGSSDSVATLEPAIKALAPAPDRGWAHVGPSGAGHFTKMVHNGIEYGMMQALAEGLDLLRAKREFNLDLAQVSEVWRHGSVVRSWLLDLTAEVLGKDQRLDGFTPVVADSGEGRWTVTEAVERGVALPVITLALQMRFASQDAEHYQGRLLSMMRNAFGGHSSTRE